jgi:hypothetical protein
MIILPPFDTSQTKALNELVKTTAFGGENAINAHLRAISNQTINSSHIVIGIGARHNIFGWLSLGAESDIGKNESVVRCYLDCIYIKEEFRKNGISTIAIEEASDALTDHICRELPELNREAIPLDLELSAKYVNTEGRSCVNYFGKVMAKCLERKLDLSDYVLRQFIDESSIGF